MNLSSTTKALVATELRRHLLAVLREGAHAVGRTASPDKSDAPDAPDAPGTPDLTDLTGVTCLARGADSVFAEVLIELGGRLEVIVPSSDYRQAQVPPDHAPQFDLLMDRAESVKVMPSPTAGPEAYVAANNAMLDEVDLLLAVWDGDEGAEGGTGHVVNEAIARQIPVTVIWPQGSQRT